jgi:glycosyltransferase involved in cell wall biosynthesis
VKIAYLIDRDSVGGGIEYVYRQMAAHPDDETRVFFSERGECTAANMSAWGAEIIHANHLKSLLQLFCNPFARVGSYVIFTVHGIHLRKFDFLPKSFFYRAKRFIRLSLERWLYRKCDQLIALTETDAEDIKRLYGENLPVVVEANSIDVSCLKPPVGLRYGESEFAFVCIARFDFQKGQDILVKAIDLAQKELRASGKRTLLIGGGATLEETKGFVDEKGISDLVEFAEEIPDAGVYMTCGQTLVAPSRWEGMPYLLLEAVARGRGIIASDCPGNRDVLRDCSNAKMFPVEDSDRLAELMVENVA